MTRPVEINGVQISEPNPNRRGQIPYVRIGSHGTWHLAHDQNRNLVELAAAIAGPEYVRYCAVHTKISIALDGYCDARKTSAHHDAKQHAQTYVAARLAALKQRPAT